MSNSVILDSILSKLPGINDKLSELYQIVEDVKKIKSGLIKYETIFSNLNSKFTELSNSFSKKIEDLEKNKILLSQLESRKNELHNEVQVILTNYKKQQEKIDVSLVHLNTQKTSNQSLQKQLNQAFEELDNNIKQKLTDFETLLKHETENIYPILINKIEQDLSIFKDKKTQEINQKIQNIEQSENRKIDARLDKIAEEQSIFIERQNRIIQQQKTLIDNLTSQLDTLQRISEKDMREKTESIENIEARIKSSGEILILAVNKKIEQMKQDVEKYVTEKTAKKGFFG